VSRGRAFRRTMRLVLRKRRRYYGGRSDKPSGLAPDAAFLGRVVDTPHPCSCYMCCNHRRSPLAKGKSRLTIQEQRAGLTVATWEFGECA
jgi:hypothetical protein